MTTHSFLDYLASLKSFSNLKDFFHHLSGLELELLDREGNPLHSSQARKQMKSCLLSCFPSGVAHPYDSEALDKTEDRTCRDAFQNALLQAQATRQKQIFLCPQSVLKKFILPIIIHGNVCGFLFSGEKENCRLSASKLDSVIRFLEDTLDSLISQDVVLLKNFTGNKVTHQEKVIQKAVEFIKHNYHQSDLTLNKLSQEYNISYFHLSRLFRKQLKITFSSYLNNLRMDVASKLLRDHSLTVTQVSYSCGFEDPAYFSKVFKRAVGASPASYRCKPAAPRVKAKR